MLSKLLLITAVVVATCAATPLDDYVNKPDPNYKYEYAGVTRQGNGWTAYMYNMTSQAWLTPADSSRPIWWHQMALIVPSDLKPNSTKALLWITGNENHAHESWPKADDVDMIVTATMAVYSRAPAAVLWQVPNQRITFPCDPFHESRTEDAVIALTWWHFLRDTSKPEWILELPMTKAAVRALDMMQSALPAHTNGRVWDQFMIAGASKRGWITWLVGAVDKRVVAIMPIVLDALNFVAFFHRQYRMYGGWTFAVKDYYQMNFTHTIDSPETQLLASIIDPYYYLPRLTMPKLVMNAVGDEFQMPDDQRHWAGHAVGETNFMMVKNADHTMITGLPEVLQGGSAFMESVVSGNPRPKYTWHYNETNGDIIVQTAVVPKKVTIAYGDSAQGVSKGKRDFRWAALNVPFCPVHILGGCIRPVIWKTTDKVERLSATQFRAHFDAPADGWRSFMIEMHFPNPGGSDDFILTSPASVVPTTYPFPDCHGAGCIGTMV